MALVVYFFVVTPYEAAKKRLYPAQPDADTVDPNTELLTEIRDELRARR
jgi:large conductance mechanosensitive channel